MDGDERILANPTTGKVLSLALCVELDFGAVGDVDPDVDVWGAAEVPNKRRTL